MNNNESTVPRAFCNCPTIFLSSGLVCNMLPRLRRQGTGHSAFLWCMEKSPVSQRMEVWLLVEVWRCQHQSTYHWDVQRARVRWPWRTLEPTEGGRHGYRFCVRTRTPSTTWPLTFRGYSLQRRRPLVFCKATTNNTRNNLFPSKARPYREPLFRHPLTSDNLHHV